jgi:hypothetical protein
MDCLTNCKQQQLPALTTIGAPLRGILGLSPRSKNAKQNQPLDQRFCSVDEAFVLGSRV